MSEQQPARWRFWFTALVMFAGLAHLAWEHFNGGVVSHHLLARSDLPAISNGWGALVLPALAWFLSGRVERRLAPQPGRPRLAAGLRPSVIAGFFGALLLGILLSIAFTQGLQTLASALFMGAFVLALLLRVYRAEYLMGFVLGMTFTFGAVLPTLIGSIIAAISAMVHLGIRPLLARLWSKLGNKGSVTTRKA